MIKDQYNEAFNQILQENAQKLLATQYKVLQSSYENKSGHLARALSSGSAVSATGGRIELDYPIYIRFLDMKKRWSKKKQKFVKKRKYAPIYNRYVYGYLKSDVMKRLNILIPDTMVRAIDDTISGKKTK